MHRSAFGLLAMASLVVCLAACTNGTPPIAETSSPLPTQPSAPVAVAETVWTGDRPTRNTSIEFTSDGMFTGTDGCNTVGGEWMTHDGRVVIRSFGTTQVYCPHVGWKETPRYGVIEAAQLTLFDEHGDVVEILTITT